VRCLETPDEPGTAFAEIARVLNPDDLYIFTMPYHAQKYAGVSNGTGRRDYLPCRKGLSHKSDPPRSLVVPEWDVDHLEYIFAKSALLTTIH
jgi:hypothetical protein